MGIDSARYRNDVRIIGQDNYLICGRLFHRFQQFRCRGIHRLTSYDKFLHPEAVEDAADSRSRRHRNDRARNRFWDREALRLFLCSRFAHPSLFHDLFGQVRHPDALGSTYFYAGFNGRPDVIGMDVTIPEPITADYDDRVT